jgi:rsbT co-antagonist protein RsbR
MATAKITTAKIEGLSRIPEILKNFCGDIAHDWFRQQLNCGISPELLDDTALRQASREFLELLVEVTQAGNLGDIYGEEWHGVREFLVNLTHERFAQGFSAWENATFIFTLRPTVYGHVQSELGQDSPHLLRELDVVSTLLEQLGLWMMEVFYKTQLDLTLAQQQAELSQAQAEQAAVVSLLQAQLDQQALERQALEQKVLDRQPEAETLATGQTLTPLQLWQDILALSLPGNSELASLQAQMAQLLTEIARIGATGIILDLSGLPQITPEMAEQLSQSLTAAHLLGATCYLTGLRPPVAQALAATRPNLTGIVGKPQIQDALTELLRQRGWKPTSNGAAL